jgi:hypothetical protein
MVNEVQVGAYNSLLHKLLSMKEAAPAPTLAPEVIAAFVLESDRPEWSFLKGERLGIGGNFVGGDAVNRPRVFLVNPVGSGVLCVVEDFWPATDGATIATGELRFGGGTMAAPFTDGNRAINRDLRSIGIPGGNAPMTCHIWSGVGPTVLPGSILSQFTLGVNQGVVVLPLEFVLPPGFVLEVSNQNTSGTIAVTYRWRERALDPAETR